MCYFVCCFSYLYFYTYVLCFFFFKQKTAYEMRISDWSSDVCSSDLLARTRAQRGADALYAIFMRAASSPADGRAPEPVVNIVVDQQTFVEEIGRASCRERVCQYV